MGCFCFKQLQNQLETEDLVNYTLTKKKRFPVLNLGACGYPPDGSYVKLVLLGFTVNFITLMFIEGVS
jgi:hypothetical protein